MEDRNITKAEMQAMIEVQAKSAEHLAIIAKSLQDISRQEEKIQTRLYDGLSKEITESLCREIAKCEVNRLKDLDDMRKIAQKISEDTTFLKWLFTGLAALVAVSWIIFKVIERLISSGVSG